MTVKLESFVLTELQPVSKTSLVRPRSPLSPQSPQTPDPEPHQERPQPCNCPTQDSPSLTCSTATSISDTTTTTSITTGLTDNSQTDQKPQPTNARRKPTVDTELQLLDRKQHKRKHESESDQHDHCDPQATDAPATPNTACLSSDSHCHENQLDDEGTERPTLQHLSKTPKLEQHDARAHPRQLTQTQIDSLSSLIKIIRLGDYDEFIKTLTDTRDFKDQNQVLNAFVDGQTVLHYTLLYGRSLAWCKQLILNGANPNLTNRAGWHPIHLAAFNGSRETMRYLIDCIAAS